MKIMWNKEAGVCKKKKKVCKMIPGTWQMYTSVTGDRR